MRLLKFFTASVLVLLAVAACKDERESYLPGDILGLSVSGHVVAPIYAGGYNMAVLKSGKGFDEAKVTVELASAEHLAAYNAENGTDYVQIPEDSFESVLGSFKFSEKDFAKPIAFKWDVKTVYDAMSALSGTPVIAVAITSGSIEVKEGRELAVIELQKSTLSLDAGKVDESGLRRLERTVRTTAPVVSSFKIMVNVDNIITSSDLSLRFEVDNSLIEGYNNIFSKHFKAAPAGLLSSPPDTCRIIAGTTSAEIELKLNTAVLFTDGEFTDSSQYMVPLKLAGTDVEGVAMKDNLVYILITPKLSGVNITRLWGKYPGSDYWFKGFLPEMEANNDRNMAIDGEYVYVAIASNTKKGIYAINLENPSIVKTVNMTGVSGGYFETSCVRTIFNPSTGKYILLASSMSMEGGSPLKIYAWTNGIENAPVAIMTEYAIPTWAERRFGDAFNVVGDWSKGQIWMRSFSSNTTAQWSIENGVIKNQASPNPWFVQSDYTGFGELYRYDMDSDDVLFVNTENSDAGVAAHAGFWKLNLPEGVNVGEETRAMPGFVRTFGFSRFTFEHKDYIAYVTVEADRSRGMLRVIEDYGSAARFADALIDNSVDPVFEAPIQHESDTEANKASEKYRSYLLIASCDAKSAGNDVYIAAHIQGVGLSVFKME